jgi:hypothetical protein
MGGIGTYTAGSTTNEIYGDFSYPDELGSGGSDYHPCCATAGGGLLRITANTILLDGTIQANGGDSESFAGGSGGGIRIDVGTLSGSGTISANGGSDPAGYGYKPGAGGGGRIAVYYDDISGFDLANITAYGGDGYYKNGGAGTLYLKSSAQSYGDLIVDNRGAITDGYSTPLRSIGTGISDSIIYSPTSGQSILTDADAAWPVPDAATGALGLIGLTLNPNTSQAEPRVTFEVLDNTATTITVDGDMTQVAIAGDAYIGEYTFNNLYIRGEAALSTGDDIYVLGTIEVDNAILKTHDLKLLETTQLQFTNGALDISEPLFDELSTANLSNCTITVPQGKALEIMTGGLLIDASSSIDVSGKGYAGGYTLGNATTGASVTRAGGSYGGEGGLSSSGSSAPNEVYGDYRDPAEFGSGGGDSTYAGSGGGLIHIAADSLTLDGEIRADGVSASYGGGSGGGIRLDVGTLSGAGTISATGGNAGSNWGGGSGGRIAVYYTDKSGFTGNMQAYGGTGYNPSQTYKGYGGAGTIYLKSPTQTYGDLIVDNIGRQTYGYSTPLRAIGSGVSDSIVYSPTTGQSTLTDPTATWPLPDPATGALGLIGLELNPNTTQSQTSIPWWTTRPPPSPSMAT